MRGRFEPVKALAGALLLAVSVGATLAAGCGEDEADAQTVRFQTPTEPGPNPFTEETDVRGKSKVRLEAGAGPFGGTGSDRVCDRELLIRSLRARPDRLREWARIADVEPTPEAVADYIRSLKPVTLVRDTRVTNHSFSDGKAVGYQAILQAGTAVLVDEKGVPRARCRCGNPLRPEIVITKVKCLGCPTNYKPPPPCRPRSSCYRAYPDPPPARATGDERPTAHWAPTDANQGDTFALIVEGFAPNATLNVKLTRPDGGVRGFTVRTSGVGHGGHQIQTSPSDPIGTYVAVITNDASGASARASFKLGSPSGQGPAPPAGQAPAPPAEQGAQPPAGAGGEASDLPECGPGIPKPCREGGTVVK